MDYDKYGISDAEMEAELERARALQDRMESLYVETFKILCNKKNPANVKKLDKKIKFFINFAIVL